MDKIDSLGRRINASAHSHLTKHGGIKNHRATYQSWQDMKQRCYNQKNAQYKNYGARGITVCDRWRNDFSAFLADMKAKPAGLTLDRIDNNKGYEPGNCRWATPAQQRVNQRSCVFLEKDGERLTVEEWARKIGRHPATLWNRIRSGHPVERVLTPSVFPRSKKAAIAADPPTAQGEPK